MSQNYTYIYIYIYICLFVLFVSLYNNVFLFTDINLRSKRCATFLYTNHRMRQTDRQTVKLADRHTERKKYGQEADKQTYIDRQSKSDSQQQTHREINRPTENKQSNMSSCYN